MIHTSPMIKDVIIEDFLKCLSVILSLSIESFQFRFIAYILILLIALWRTISKVLMFFIWIDD